MMILYDNVFIIEDNWNPYKKNQIQSKAPVCFARDLHFFRCFKSVQFQDFAHESCDHVRVWHLVFERSIVLAPTDSYQILQILGSSFPYLSH